jgi:hypothetical protein
VEPLGFFGQQRIVAREIGLAHPASPCTARITLTPKGVREVNKV